MNKFMLAVALLLGTFSATATPFDDTGYMSQNCPTPVQNARVAVADTADGSAVTITTESGKVAELRRSVKRMAQTHDANVWGL